jgi:hypothetical protein
MVLLKALGITHAELSVDEEAICHFKEFFDSPVREHLHERLGISGRLCHRGMSSCDSKRRRCACAPECVLEQEYLA